MVNHFCFGIMSSKVKEFSSYTIESPLLRVGNFTDSKGQILNVTKEVAADIYNNLNGAAPLKDIHIDGEPIGNIQKFTLKDDGIYQKSVITDVQRFESRYGDGHFYISPEIEVENGVTKLTGAALTSNPGMIQDKVMVTRHYFEAPPDATLAPKAETTSWQEPLGELRSTITNLNDTLSNFGDKVKNMTTGTTQNTTTAQSNVQTNSNAVDPSLTVDDLARLVNDAVEKRIASMQSPKNPEASETNQKSEPIAPDDELAKEYANLKGELEGLKKTQEKAYSKQYNALVAEMKTLGIEHPEKMAPDGLTTDQKITILESIKENFAKNSPMSAPLQEPLASGNNIKKPNTVTIDDVLEAWDEQYGSANSEYGTIKHDPGIRNKLRKLSDPDLLRKYNLPVLYDSNDNYIGPLY